MFKQGQRASIRMHLENVLYDEVFPKGNTIEDMNQIRADFNRVIDDYIRENDMKCEEGGVEVKRIDDLGRIPVPTHIRACMSPTGNHRDLDSHEVDIRKIVDPDTHKVGFVVFLHEDEEAPVRLAESTKSTVNNSEGGFLVC